MEDKFVETHKLQKALIRDRETLVAFLHVVFDSTEVVDEIILGPEQDNYGLYDINQL